MKNIFGGKEVSSRTYYYLLDWNESNQWEYIVKTFNKTRLCDLTIDEYAELFKHATESEPFLKQNDND